MARVVGLTAAATSPRQQSHIRRRVWGMTLTTSTPSRYLDPGLRPEAASNDSVAETLEPNLKPNSTASGSSILACTFETSQTAKSSSSPMQRPPPVGGE